MMTRDEFNNARFHANQWATYEGDRYYIISMSFPEGLFGLVSEKADIAPEEWNWVRCESVELDK